MFDVCDMCGIQLTEKDVDEPASDEATANPHANDGTHLMVDPNCPISGATDACLVYLRSTAAKSHSRKSPAEDLSNTLRPLEIYVAHLSEALTTVSRHLSSHHGENFAKLQQLMAEMVPSINASPILKPFFDAVGVEVKGNTPHDADVEKDKEIIQEMNVVRDAINYTYFRWM